MLLHTRSCGWRSGSNPANPGLLASLSACAGPAAPDASATDVASLRRELATLKDSMARLENKIGHLRSNVETDDLVPDVMYRLRPRNQNEQFRWIVGDGVMIAAR
jgi:hypothetical protein